MRRIAMLSVHTCPMAALGGKESGGMNVYVRELSRELGAMGLLVDIYTRSQDPTSERVRTLWPNVRVMHLPAGPEEPYNKNLVYEHLPEFVDGLCSFAASEGLHYDLIHSHYWLSGLVGRELNHLTGAPTVHMFHTLARMKDLVAAEDSPKEDLSRVSAEDQLVRDMDRIIAATPLDKAQMVDLYGADPDKIRIIPLGVDLRTFRRIPKKRAMSAIGLDLPGNPRLILFVGRLDPVKGLETLLRAMCDLSETAPELARDLCLAVIGGDEDDKTPGEITDELECLEKLKNEAGLTNLVAFLGSRAQDTLANYYSAADVCVVPSYYESFGLVALEAMACGTPVIASRVGGLLHTVEDNVTGFFFPAGDPQALAQRLRQVLEDPALQRRLGQNGRKRAQKYTWPKVASQISDVYEELWHSAK